MCSGKVSSLEKLYPANCFFSIWPSWKIYKIHEQGIPVFHVKNVKTKLKTKKLFTYQAVYIQCTYRTATAHLQQTGLGHFGGLKNYTLEKVKKSPGFKMLNLGIYFGFLVNGRCYNTLSSIPLLISHSSGSALLTCVRKSQNSWSFYKFCSRFENPLAIPTHHYFT